MRPRWALAVVEPSIVSPAATSRRCGVPDSMNSGDEADWSGRAYRTIEVAEMPSWDCTMYEQHGGTSIDAPCWRWTSVTAASLHIGQESAVAGPSAMLHECRIWLSPDELRSRATAVNAMKIERNICQQLSLRAQRVP
jgi:hypothetical protein